MLFQNCSNPFDRFTENIFMNDTQVEKNSQNVCSYVTININ